MEHFPPNSMKSRERSQNPRPSVDPVTSSAVRRRKPLGRQFKETFFGGDGKTAVEYVVFHVLIPAAKETLLEAGTAGIEKLIYGASRAGRGPRPNPYGHVDYRRMSQPRQVQDDRPPFPRAMSRAARARHNFDEIVIASRQEAEEVLERLGDLIDKYESASVGDLYELTGLESSHQDQKWGWTDLRGSTVVRLRGGGYLLNLPDPETLP